MNERVIVVGAGIAGLACAHELRRAGREVCLLEASPRAGGVVRTRREGAFQFEDGPNTVPSTAAHLRELCADLGLASRLVTSAPEAAIRYLYHRGRLVALPLRPPELLRSPLLSPLGKLRLLTEPLRPWREPDPDPPLAAFLARRIGREAAARLGGAFVRGVHAAEAGTLGAASAFPRLWHAAREHGGLFRALRALRGGTAPSAAGERGALLSLPGGFGELIDALVESLGPRLRTGWPVQSLERIPGGWRVRASERSEEAADLVLALPAVPTADLLEEHLPGDLLAPLRDLPHADVTVVHLGLEPLAHADAPLAPPGFGFLVPPDAGPGAPAVLGMLFPANLFPGRAPAGCASFTAIYRTADRKGMEREALVEGVLEDLERALGRRPAGRVAASAVARWHAAIPHYVPGHAARASALLAAAASLPGLCLAGNWHGGISLDDRVAAGRSAARELLARRAA